MQTQINPSLQALLQTAQMVTPEQGPTVAAKVAQAAQQKMQSQAAPPGIEALMPGVQQQAMMSAQAAQPATQGDVNQLRQMLARAQQGQGVAQLPGADVEMAEGGIVGYNGQTGSFISNLSMEEIERMSPDMRKAYFKEMLARRNAPVPTSAAPVTPPAASMRPGLGMAGAVAKKLGPLGLLAELFTTSDEDVATLENARVQREAAKYPEYSDTGRARLDAPTPSAPVVPEDTAAFMSQYANVRGQGRRGPLAEAPAPRPPAPPGERKPAAEVAKPTDAGIASLMGPPVPSGSERQFGEAMAAQGRIEIPQERTPAQIAAERAAYYRSQGIDPNFMQARMERIAAQEKRDQEEAAARAALVKDRGIENLISRLSRVQGPTLFSGLGAAQRGMEPIVAEQRASDERFRALMRERQREADRERAAIEDVQRALADGDIARAEKSRSEALAARNAKAAAEAEMRGRYAPQLLQAETAALDRASREREGAESRKTQLQVAQIGVSKPTAREFDYALFRANPEKYKEFLAAGAEPKSEGAMLKEIVGAVLKNPLMMQQYPPAIQALVNQELLKLGVTPALPKGAPVRE